VTDFNKDDPEGTVVITQGDDAIRANMAALEERLGKEHHFPDNADAARQGRHKFGAGGSAARDVAFTAPVSGNVWWDTTSSVWQVYNAIHGAWITIGNLPADIKMVGRNPLDTAGWLRCDGREVATASYGLLHSYIGSNFDDNGVDPAPAVGNFRIPRMQGRVPVGRLSGDPDFGNVGDYGGEKEHTLITAEMPAHSHSGTTDPAKYREVAAAIDEGGGPTQLASDGTGTHVHTFTTNPQGGGDPHNNIQPFLTLGFKIYTAKY